jgi:hypothetical protein
MTDDSTAKEDEILINRYRRLAREVNDPLAICLLGVIVEELEAGLREQHVREALPAESAEGMYEIPRQIYGCRSQGAGMAIGRREFLVGAASFTVEGLAGPSNWAASEDPASPDCRWHPLTRSLLHRASRAGQRLDRPRVESIVREVAGERGPPVIKWMNSASHAFEHLRRYSLAELAQMPTARFWPLPSALNVFESDGAERSVNFYLHASQVLNVEEHGRALLAPKLASKAAAMASRSDPQTILEARAAAAEIGWIETSLPAVAARAIRAVEDLLLSGHAEDSEPIYHQLGVFEAFERGLLATWETPDELLCLPSFI